MAIRLPDDLRAEIIDHCLAEAPNEGCGLVAFDDEVVMKIYRTANADRSAIGYTVPPDEHYSALEDAESQGWEIGGVFHSHPNGPAQPSMTDIVRALDQEWVYLVVGLLGEPEIKAWRIRDRKISEIPID